MGIIENIPIDTFIFLVFIVPGFFFLIGFNIFNFKKRSSLSEIAYSLILGFMLMIFYYYVLPEETFYKFTKNIYSIVIIFSLLNFILGLIIRAIFETIKGRLNSGY